MALDERAQFGQTPVRRRFPGSDPSPFAVRQFLDGVLQDWGLAVGPTRDTVLLLGSELASNAVQHTAAGFTVSIRVAGVQARVDVYDTEVELPTLRQPTVDDERGRGLVLVNRLASDWGAKPAAGGKVVWFEVALSSDGEPADPP